MKTIKVLSLFLCIIAAITSSCSLEQEIDVLQKDTPFISLPETTDFNNLTSYEIDILYGLVEPRIELTVNSDGLYQMKAKSGADINISENIFLYFDKIVNRINRFILKHRSTGRNKLISRSEADAYGVMYDCVAHAIYGAGKAPSVEAAKKQIGYNVANGGIPKDDMLKILKIFGNAVEVRRLDLRTPETFNRPLIVVTRPDPTTNMGHAINAIKQEGTSLICNDYTNGSQDTLLIGETYFIYMYLD